MKTIQRIWQKGWARWAVLILIVASCYVQVLDAPFIWDDLEMVEGNALIRSWGNLSEVFQSSAFGGRASKSGFYRPIQIATYFFDYHFWGLNPTGFHLTNLIIHLVNVGLLFMLLPFFGFSALASWVIALLFGLHPLHIESVSYISGRGDVFFLTFVLGSFLSFFKGLKGHRVWFLSAVVLFLISLITKENCITYPIVLLSFCWLNHDRLKGKWPWGTVAILNLSAVAFVLYRLWPLGSGAGGTLSFIARASFFERVMTVPYILITYLKLFLVPYPLHMEYHYVEQSVFSPYIWIGLPVLAALVFLSVKKLENPRQTLFFWGWFFLGLGPVYQVGLALASTIREHWMYFPSIGLFMLAAKSSLAVRARWRPHVTNRVLAGLIGVSIIYLGGLTWHRNADWRDPIRLYGHDVSVEPKSFVLHNNLGYVYYFKGDFKKAKAAFRKSIDVSPGNAYGTAYNNLGVIVEGEGDLADAEKLYEKSILYSSYYLAYTNLSRIYIQNNRFGDAEKLLIDALEKFPDKPQFYYYLAILNFNTGRILSAERFLQKLEMLSPNYLQTRELLKQINQKKLQK
ncbi:MAG: tetratricopeptide (TPR) repeat protein [Candidatus Marinamargulisbacteria bacterium]|jgi:tetratricopeptide (TPR) repeat protein